MISFIIKILNCIKNNFKNIKSNCIKFEIAIIFDKAFLLEIGWLVKIYDDLKNDFSIVHLSK
jgi:hypothetical protein